MVDGTLELRNCPFHRVAQEQTALVCGLNLEYVGGVCEGLDCQVSRRRWNRLPTGAVSERLRPAEPGSA